MYLIVSILHLDVPQLQAFASDPVVQEAFLKHIGSPKSKSDKNY